MNKVGDAIVFIGLAVIYYLARLPFFPLILRGEEGIFADIFLNQPEGPLYQQMGRLNGETIYTIIEHPALIYETLAFVGSLWQQIIDVAGFSPLGLTIFLRFAFSTFEWLIWLLLFVGISLTGPYYQAQHRNKFFGVLLLSMIWPASLLNTTNINIDATVGVWTSGFVCFSVLLFRNRQLPRLPLYVILSGAAFFFGFGKNELSLVFGLALLATGLLCGIGWRLGWLDKLREPLTILLVAMLANQAGNLFNYWFDPVNYNAGWGVLHSRGSQASLIATRDFGAWFLMTMERQSFIFIHLLFWCSLLLSLWQKRRAADFFTLFFFVLGSALFFGYFFAYSEVGARYFEPSFIALLFGFVTVFSHVAMHRQFKRAFTVIAVIFLLHSGVEITTTSIRQVQNPALRQSRFELPPEVLRTGCVPLLEQAAVFDRPEIDYIATAELVDTVLRAGRIVCEKTLPNGTER